MAWIAALIGAGASYYSSRQQKKATKPITDQESRLYGIQADTAEKLQPYALDFYNKANQAADPALGYYRALASGDTSKTYAALSPELAQIGQRYRSLFNASSELNQRGGMSASYAAELPFQEMTAKNDLVKGARSSAYGDLARLFGQFANAGGSAAGGSISAAGAAGSTLNNSYMMSLMNSGRLADTYGEIGKALGSMFGRDKNGSWYIGNNPGPG